MNFKPLYPTSSYKEFVAYQKLKGLSRKNWKDLPKMWEEELSFRKEIENMEANVKFKKERKPFKVTYSGCPVTDGNFMDGNKAKD